MQPNIDEQFIHGTISYFINYFLNVSKEILCILGSKEIDEVCRTLSLISVVSIWNECYNAHLRCMLLVLKFIPHRVLILTLIMAMALSLLTMVAPF